MNNKKKLFLLLTATILSAVLLFKMHSFIFISIISTYLGYLIIKKDCLDQRLSGVEKSLFHLLLGANQSIALISFVLIILSWSEEQTSQRLLLLNTLTLVIYVIEHRMILRLLFRPPSS
jgi:hypothetical protein